MQRGDITGMSFAFEDDYEDTENGVSYERTAETHNGKEVWLRHVNRITGLYDVAIVTHPAYQQTSVGTREQSESIDKTIEEQLKREAGNDDAQKQREAEEQAKREQEEREERELQEQEQRFRQQQAMRLRYKAQRLNDEIIESLNV